MPWVAYSSTKTLHVGIAQDVLLAKPLLNCSLCLLCGEPFDADGASDGQDDLSAIVDAESLGKLRSVEDANIEKISGVE